MSDIIDRLNGNGEPWTFGDIIAEITKLRAALELSNANCDRMSRLAIDNAKDLLECRAALSHADAKGQENDMLFWGTVTENKRRWNAAIKELKEHGDPLATEIVRRYRDGQA